MDRIRVYTGGVASCNGYLFKTRDNAYVAVDAPSGFADWIYSKKPDIIITDPVSYTHLTLPTTERV